ncbi:spore germination protein KB [Symbiobacterium terraclitae]|uniref:Spore germination protein KB n=1 Tax=Symbiobacterium terraclitae TaxID=557451 RepID=A0ABS4JMY2_9FIRM|nr:endospore germination permease [Symbiobacterium terraclitae]MBP2016892.1 spore germination protein KB [Symbiobacterium terraclitae]
MAQGSRSQGSTGGLARISSQQLLSLAYTMHFTAAVLVAPSSMAKFGHSGAWLAPPVAFLLSALPVSLMLGLLVRRHPHQTLAQMTRHLLGPVLGRLVGLMVSVFSVVVAAATLRDVVEVTPVAILPATPAWALSVPFLLVTLYGAYSGVEVVARLSYLFALATVMVILLGISTLTGLIHPLRLLPLYERSPLQLLQASWPAMGWFAESWSFLAVAALVDREERVGRSLVLGAGLAALMLTAFTALAITVFGHQLVAQFSFPIYSLVQQIAIGEFVERLDVLLFAIWLVGMLVKVSAHLWMAASGAGCALALKNQRQILPALGLTAHILMSLVPNLNWLDQFSINIWTPISLSLGLGVPALLLAASWVRQRRQCGGMGPDAQQQSQ